MRAVASGSIESVVILGGGTAGWMTAAYLGKALQNTVSITVLEAPSIPRIGVGEATVPNLQRVFFDYLGIAENDWMRECNAAFKTAVRFVNWRTPGEGSAVARTYQGRPDHFYHPFGLLPEHEQIPLSHYWNRKRMLEGFTEPFDYACFKEPAIIDAYKAPRWADGRPATRYAWHFDARLVADFLQRFATQKQGVKHVTDEMSEAVLDEQGFITALRCTSGRVIEGDLFVDCSGFSGLLINKALGEPFLDMGDQLLCDRAVAAAIPHDDEAHGIDPCTSAIAMKSGWTWKIPMLGRFGSGYVYSSRFASQDEATEDFCRMWGLDPQKADLNQVRFRVGRNRRSWVKNCVSIGLASMFLEPLESTGIYFTYAAIYQLAKFFPDRGFDPVLADAYNTEVATMFDDTRDFIQAHFYLAPRTDTPFWRANKELTLGPDILQKMQRYKAGLAVNAPSADENTYYANFEAEFRNFWTNGSYYAVFTGMGYFPDRTLPSLAYKPQSVEYADQLFDEIRRQQQLVDTMPGNHEYLRALHNK